MNYKTKYRMQNVEIAKETGSLEIIRDKYVLVISDAQNIDAGARDLGFSISWERLGQTIDMATGSAFRYLIFAHPPRETARCEQFSKLGWTAHAKVIQTVQTHKGTERKSNADNLFCFIAGALTISSHYDVVVLASGDGDLVSDTAEAILRIRPQSKVATLSLAGSTAYRLNAKTSPHITANIEIGLDCLRPIKEAIRC